MSDEKTEKKTEKTYNVTPEELALLKPTGPKALKEHPYLRENRKGGFIFDCRKPAAGKWPGTLEE